MEEYDVEVHFCDTCQTEYLYWSDDEPLSWSLYTIVNGKMYRWTYSMNGTALLYFVKEPGIPGTRKNNGLEKLYSCPIDAGPEMTPQNVADKIKTILVFA